MSRSFPISHHRPRLIGLHSPEPAIIQALAVYLAPLSGELICGNAIKHNQTGGPRPAPYEDAGRITSNPV